MTGTQGPWGRFRVEHPVGLEEQKRCEEKPAGGARTLVKTHELASPPSSHLEE